MTINKIANFIKSGKSKFDPKRKSRDHFHQLLLLDIKEYMRDLNKYLEINLNVKPKTQGDSDSTFDYQGNKFSISIKYDYPKIRCSVGSDNLDSQNPNSLLSKIKKYTK